MTIYKTIWTTAEDEYVHLWITKEDANSAIMRMTYLDDTLRVEGWTLAPDDHNQQYEEKECWFEYDVNCEYRYLDVEEDEQE